jgi:hypothetical protein
MESVSGHPEFFNAGSVEKVNKFKKKIGYISIVFIIQFILLVLTLNLLGKVSNSMCYDNTAHPYEELGVKYFCHKIENMNPYTVNNAGMAWSIVSLIINIIMMVISFCYLGWCNMCRNCVYD